MFSSERDYIVYTNLIPKVKYTYLYRRNVVVVKYTKIHYFSLFFSELWGRVKFFFGKKWGGQKIFGKNGGEETDYRKNGGGRRRITEKIPPQGIFGTLP